MESRLESKDFKYTVTVQEVDFLGIDNISQTTLHCITWVFLSYL